MRRDHHTLRDTEGLWGSRIRRVGQGQGWFRTAESKVRMVRPGRVKRLSSRV